MLESWDEAEREFLEKKAQSYGKVVDRSGSCAIILLIVDDMGYIANVGDSRAVISTEGGKVIYALSKDHKPNCEEERRRMREELINSFLRVIFF